MAITFETNYQEIFQPDTLAEIERLVDNSYELTDMIAFIDEHSEDEFRDFYEEYVEAGENYGWEAVDAFLTLYGLVDLGNFSSSFIGEFSSPEAMAEEYYDYETQNIPCYMVIDWSETARMLIHHEVDQVGDYYFSCF